MPACGSTSFTQNVKIVGGIPAVANSWPAQILLYTEYTGYIYTGIYAGSTPTLDGICGGTLLDAYTVLTAAHCITPLNPSQYTVYVGAHNINFLSAGTSPTFPTVAMAVKSVIEVS